MGAPLDLTSRSPFGLRSARTLSTTLLGFEFLQRPQHVLSNLLDRPHHSQRSFGHLQKNQGIVTSQQCSSKPLHLIWNSTQMKMRISNNNREMVA